MIESTFLIFSLAINPSAPVHPNYVVKYDTREECVIGANAYANEFAKSYPYGLFVGQCRDNENRVFYMKRSRQFEITGESQ